MADLFIKQKSESEIDYEVKYPFIRREFYYFRINEMWTGCKFDIGEGYGILNVYDSEILERIEMTGYYYIDDGGEKVTTDEQWWSIDDVLNKKFYYQDNNEEINWNGAYVDLFIEYYDGYNWTKVWLDAADLDSDVVEEITDEVGMLKIIARNEGQTFNEYAYINDKGKYYYKYSSFFVGQLDYFEETNLETLKTLFNDLN